MAVAAWILAGCGGATSPPAGAPIPRALLRETRPVGVGPRFRPAVRGPVAGPCAVRLGRREGVHVEVFAGDRVVLIPAGIGIRPPTRLSAGRIVAARCFGTLVTVDPTGIVLVRPGARHTLSELFRSWGQPLSASRLASFTAARGRMVVAYVGGRRWRGAVGAIPLSRHAEIVLEIGPRVLPHRTFAFPLGL